MLKKAGKWLKPPNFPGDDKSNEQARIINSIQLNAFVLLFFCLSATPFLIQLDKLTFAIINILVMLLITGISRILLFSRRVEVSGGMIKHLNEKIPESIVRSAQNVGLAL